MTIEKFNQVLHSDFHAGHLKGLFEQDLFRKGNLFIEKIFIQLNKQD